MDFKKFQLSGFEEKQITETERLNVLYRYQILDTPPSLAFDSITKLAADFLAAPISLISIVDKERIWAKSNYGTKVKEYVRTSGFCATAIESNQALVITDAASDPRTSTHPLVTVEAGVRFYAGIPLTIAGGYNIGTLCIIDFKPRQITTNELDYLKTLAQLAVDEIELHYSFVSLKSINHDLAVSEKQFRSIFDQAGVGVTRVDVKTGQFLETNQKYCEIVGYTQDELKKIDILHITHPDDIAMQNEYTQDLLTNKISEYRLQKRYVKKDKSIVWVDITCTALWDKNATPTTRIAVVQDITDKKYAELALIKSEERWKFALEGSHQGIWDWETDSSEIFISSRCKDILGYAENQISSNLHEWDKLTHPDDISNLLSARSNVLKPSGKFFENEHRKLAQDGSWKWVQVKGMVVDRDSHGIARRLIGTYTDITDKKQAAAEVIRLAHFDGITNLPNRVLFLDRLNQELKKANRSNKQLALLMLDLDRFKEVNDTLGHIQGDQVIKLTAERIIECVRDTDTVGRLGGDEFMIILSDLDNPLDVEKVASKILQALALPYELEGELAYVTASIGITLYPDDADEIEELRKNADQAMYAAKAEGRNKYCYFTPIMQKSANERVSLANDLRLALKRNELDVFYQPIINIGNGEIHKAEALMRWKHPVRGWVSPATFIPIAEEIGEIVALGDWIFHQAVDAVKLCRKTINPDFKISINKSPIQFKIISDSCNTWLKYLSSQGLGGDCVVVEITESLLLEKSENLICQFAALKKANVQIALDDFGTGYSSLSYLKIFDIDYLKIDQSFVKNLAPESDDIVLCEAIIVMAHKLKMQVIAEGVETEKQLSLLRDVGCDFAQGYFISKPMPLDQFTVWSKNYDYASINNIKR